MFARVNGERINLDSLAILTAQLIAETDAALEIPTKAENRKRSGRVSRRQAEIWRTKPKRAESTTYKF